MAALLDAYIIWDGNEDNNYRLMHAGTLGTHHTVLIIALISNGSFFSGFE
jgi:hypothetical protein